MQNEKCAMQNEAGGQPDSGILSLSKDADWRAARVPPFDKLRVAWWTRPLGALHFTL